MAILSSLGILAILLSAVLLYRIAGMGEFLAAILACAIAWLLTAAAILHLARGDWFLPMAAHCAWGLAICAGLFRLAPVSDSGLVLLALAPAAVHIAVLCHAPALLLPFAGAQALLAVASLMYGSAAHMEKENKAYYERQAADRQYADEAAVATRAELEALPEDATLQPFLARTRQFSTLESVRHTAVAVAIARFPDLEARLAAAVPVSADSRIDVVRFLSHSNAPHTDATARILSDALTGLAADFSARRLEFQEDQLAVLAVEAVSAFPAHRAQLQPTLREIRRAVGAPQKAERGVISGRQELEALLR